MAAPVIPLNATAGPPALEPGDTAKRLFQCEARVRHAADRLDAAIAEMRELRGLVQRMRDLDAPVRDRTSE